MASADIQVVAREPDFLDWHWRIADRLSPIAPPRHLKERAPLVERHRVPDSIDAGIVSQCGEALRPEPPVGFDGVENAHEGDGARPTQ